MRNLLLIGTVALALTACKGSETINTQVETAKAETASIMEVAKEMQQADVNVKLNAWFEDKFMERARRYPQRLAGLGIKERMDEWNDPSRAFALEEPRNGGITTIPSLKCSAHTQAYQHFWSISIISIMLKMPKIM